MSNAMDVIEKSLCKSEKNDFRPGDKIRVHVKVSEGEKTRTQVYEGVCLAIKNASNRASITVRKISYGVGVERVFPLHSPSVEKIELVQRGQVRQSRIYYLRELEGKAARIRSQEQQSVEQQVEAQE